MKRIINWFIIDCLLLISAVIGAIVSAATSGRSHGSGGGGGSYGGGHGHASYATPTRTKTIILKKGMHSFRCTFKFKLLILFASWTNENSHKQLNIWCYAYLYNSSIPLCALTLIVCVCFIVAPHRISICFWFHIIPFHSIPLNRFVVVFFFFTHKYFVERYKIYRYHHMILKWNSAHFIRVRIKWKPQIYICLRTYRYRGIDIDIDIGILNGRKKKISVFVD